MFIEQHICRFQSFRQKLFSPDLTQQEKVRYRSPSLIEIRIHLIISGRNDSLCL